MRPTYKSPTAKVNAIPSFLLSDMLRRQITPCGSSKRHMSETRLNAPIVVFRGLPFMQTPGTVLSHIRSNGTQIRFPATVVAR